MTIPLVIGLTGGSGSGKSEVARVLRGFGAVAVDADEVSREAADDPDVLSRLKAALGDWVVGVDGRFDRKAVGRRVFSDRNALEALTVITHDYIIKAIDERVRAYRAGQGAGYGAVHGAWHGGAAPALVLDAPLPVRRGFLDNVDVVWAVVCDVSKKVERIVSRDGIDAELARARLAAQMADADYARLADVVLTNNGSLADLERSARQAWDSLWPIPSFGGGSGGHYG